VPLGLLAEEGVQRPLLPEAVLPVGADQLLGMARPVLRHAFPPGSSGAGSIRRLRWCYTWIPAMKTVFITDFHGETERRRAGSSCLTTRGPESKRCAAGWRRCSAPADSPTPTTCSSTASTRWG